MTPLAGGQREIPRVIDQLLHRGRARFGTEQNLHLTDAGEAARGRLRGLVTELRAEVHKWSTTRCVARRARTPC